MKYNFKRLLALTLAVVMVLALVPAGQAHAADVSYAPLENISANLTQGTAIAQEHTMDEDQVVRAMIVLKEQGAISKVKGSESYLTNAAAQDHRSRLQLQQEKLCKTISQQVLKGEELDVVWNLTLMTNAISVNVPYGALAEISGLPEVAEVFVETVYYPQEAETNNIVSQEMTGASVAQNTYGYYGEGQRIAVIDTGTDTDHQSFSAAGFEYALARNAAAEGMSLDEYMEHLDLMDVDAIAQVLPQLNVSRRYYGLTAEDLYLSSKLPFNFNYVDGDLNVTHDYDDQSSHGSHVAGIAAANRYIPIDKVSDLNGDGAFDAADAQVLMDHVILGTDAETLFAADLDHNGQLDEVDVTLMLDALSGVLCADAAKTVGVTGVAPDAQLITMKVFGVTGGAYTSDYMAAVEDAVVLGCDTVNLSLGASNPGFTYGHDSSGITGDHINELMAALEETGIIMCVSAGNSGNWADNDDAYQLMYADETGTFNTSEPSTYTNALGVASADNVGQVSDRRYWFTGKHGDLDVTLDAASAGLNADWITLDPMSKGTGYEAVFLGDPSGLLTGQEQTDLSIYGGSVEDYVDVEGKIVLVARGNLVSFADKHSNAALAGAAGVIIYNNVTDPIYASIEGSTATIPCGTISLETAMQVYRLFGGRTGKFTVSYTLNVDQGEGEATTMSSFSSWGPTGGLTLKPELTGPGGNIYSVNGVDTSGSAYEHMSGTSMSSPHISGLMALATQYIQERGLDKRTGLSQRVLAQSLMMSTAEPIMEGKLPYSVRNQGAGLASIEKVLQADTYLLVDGQSGGKVKAELGDGTDTRNFTFTLNNLTDTPKTYTLSAQLMTTGTTTIDGHALTTDEMVALSADVRFSCGETVTVAPGGTRAVNVSITVDPEAAKEMKELGNVHGFYIEGFVYATAVADGEGSVGASHSIPLLGYYGNWTDASMFETNTYLDFAYDTLKRPAHMNDSSANILAWAPVGYGAGLYYSGNIYGSPDGEGDSRYLEERNAINTTGASQWELFAVYPTLIRGAADYKVTVYDSETGEVYYFNDFEGEEDYLISSFYHTGGQQWYNTTTECPVDLSGWDLTDQNGNPLAEGTNFTIEVGCAPDYYIQEDGTADWSKVGQGAYLRYSFTVDNTAPDLVGSGLKLEGDKLTYEVQDNRHIAAVILLTGDASTLVSYSFPDMDAADAGKAVTGALDLTGYRERYGNKAAIAICDYAGNETYYAINLGGEGESYGSLMGFRYDEEGYVGSWVAFDEGVNRNESALFGSDVNIVAAEYVNGLIYAQDANGNLYGIRYSDMLKNQVNLEKTFITKLTNTYQDFAYNYYDGKLYGLYTYEYDGYPYAEIDTINLKGEYYDPDMWMTIAPYQEDWAAQQGGVYALSMAIDDAGSVYLLGPAYDFETEELSATAHLHKAMMEENWGWVSLGAFEDVGDTGMGMDYLQSMTWDHNTESLYWAQFNAVGWNTLETALVKLNPETAEPTVVGTLSSETAGLMAPLTAETQATHTNVPAFDASVAAAPTLSAHNLTMGVGGYASLSLTYDPWYSEDKEMVWTSSDENVVTVDQQGNLKATGEGKATITVAAKNDETKFDTCDISVASLTLNIEGIVSYTGGGVGSAYGSKLYDIAMEKGVPTFHEGALISAPAEFEGYGLSIAAAVAGRGSLWACEYGNTGMIYEIDPDTGVVQDMLEPIDGDMIFGLSYSEKTDLFSGIMNFYFYADLPMNHEMNGEILGSYDETTHEFMWHKFDMSEYLAASDESFNTGEAGNGSIVDVVFSGITDIDNVDGTSYYMSGDFTGNGWYESSYTPATTHVILDNVGRLWYIDETVGMYKEESQWETFYWSESGDSINGDTYGVFAQDMGDGTYNVFLIRQVVKTPMTDLYLQGAMPRITYHFSDLHYAGRTAEGAPMFFVSMYDYWNEGTTNQLYLYIPGIEYGERYWDMDKMAYVQPTTPDSLYDLGTTGFGNIIASITDAEVIDGLPAVEIPEEDGETWNALTVGPYRTGK